MGVSRGCMNTFCHFAQCMVGGGNILFAESVSCRRGSYCMNTVSFTEQMVGEGGGAHSKYNIV